MTCSLLSKKQKIDIPLLFHWHSAHSALEKEKKPTLDIFLNYIQKRQSYACPDAWGCGHGGHRPWVCGTIRERAVWLECQVMERLYASRLSTVLAKRGRRAWSDHTFLVSLLWPLTAALPVELPWGLLWQLLGGRPRPQSEEQGPEGRLEKSCRAAQTARRRERDQEVKFTLGQICVLSAG